MPKFSPKTLADVDRMFPTDADAKAYLVGRRWPKGVVCPRCGNKKVWALKARPFNWLCKSEKCLKASTSGYRFSLYVGTIFENTNYALKTWFKVLYLMLQSKKGMSALQIQRMLGMGSYRTAWYMCHRLRAGLMDPDFQKLMGVVEVDETFIGGKDKNRHAHKKSGVRGSSSGKVGVIGAISRKGNVVCRIIENTDERTLVGFVDTTVSQSVKLLATDEFKSYNTLKEGGFAHKTVSHRNKEYVRGIVHTNSIESFWSLLKRGVMGTYHNVSKKYLPLYLNEFTFRHNNRGNADMFGEAIASC